jgi:drug/metabolite transporter (DMT)-like permease
VGLAAINVVPAIKVPAEGGKALLTGVIFSILAVTLWVVFSVLNQRSLEKAPDGDLTAWTGFMMAGTGVAMALFLPLGITLGLSNFPRLGFGVNALPLYASAFVLAAMSSVVGAWAWNYATQKLPMAVTGQLISVETIFATIFGLAMHTRLPTWDEVVGITLVVLGTTIGVRHVYSARAAVGTG